MVTRLLIMRHAKSSWKDPSLTDHQRPLNARGKKAATLIGETLSAQGLAPDIIWSSDSERTRQTAKRLIRAIPGAQTVQYFPELYHAGLNTVLPLCAEQAEPDGALMLLGHNPGWSEIFTYLTGQSHPFPTAACAVFNRRENAPTSEAEPKPWLNPENWQCVQLLLPRELDA